MIVIPMAVSVGVPLAFLYAVRRLDLYATGTFGLFLVCFAAGLIAFPAALAVNTMALRALSLLAGLTAAQVMLTVRTLVAPATEEVLKSVGVVASVRRTDFTYFVDGAICGFAAGTAFAVVENTFYLRGAGLADGLALAVNRAFTTSLMHGSASALVGVALGRARFDRGRARVLALAVGWTAAIVLHASFNRMVVTGPMTPAKLGAAYAIGLGGVAATAAFIAWGLREEKGWLRQSLGLGVGVTQNEAAVVQCLSDLDALLRPVEEHFGLERRRQVEAILRTQARLGLKVKARELSTDSRMQAALGDEIAQLRGDIDSGRRAVGVYCMLYVRCILPPEAYVLWDRLQVVLAEEREPAIDMWKVVKDRTSAHAPGDAAADADGGQASDDAGDEDPAATLPKEV